MKGIIVTCIAAFLITLVTFNGVNAQSTPNLVGAWQSVSGDNETTLICSEKYFSVAIYDVKNKRFSGTYGGSYRIDGDQYVAVMEFHSISPEAVGNEYRGKVQVQKDALILEEESGSSQWKRLDDGTPGKLAGAWLITGRVRDGQMSKMTPGARRTMKILSGTRFQWIAYNTETREMSGTGGGTYTTRNGKYTENIEFFSRDNTRVGASLTFDFSLENGAWRHKGKSSKGDPIDEVWTKREKIGL
jgi:hypothetical protein